MLRRAASGKSRNGDPLRELEQQYKILYSKIGRDFVTREEFNFLLSKINENIDLDEALTLAIDKAEFYKELHDEEQIGDFQDLIDLSEGKDED